MRAASAAAVFVVAAAAAARDRSLPNLATNIRWPAGMFNVGRHDL